MNGILSKHAENRSSEIRNTRPKESVETAGSLAMNNFHSLFETNIYDIFQTSNPFAVDYSLYSDCSESVAYSGFLSSFSNAFSTLSSDGGFSGASFGGASFGGGDCGGGFSSCGSSGGFTSVC